MTQPITTIDYTSDFKKSYQNLPQKIECFEDKEDEWFRKSAFDPKLETYKLKRELKGY